MSDGGWIKIHRKIIDNPLFEVNPSARHVFVDLLFRTAWKDTVLDWRGRPVTIQRGQVMISVRGLCAISGKSLQEIRTIISNLATHRMIEINTPINRGPMVITICNYSKYQDQQHTANTPNNTQPTHPLTHSQHTKEEEEEERKETPLTPQGGNAPRSKDLLGDTTQDEPQVPKSKAQPIQEAYDAYQAIALECNLPQSRSLTPSIRKSIGARLREYGIDGWRDALAAIERSSFLTGGNDREWRVSLPWLIKPSNFEKVVSGNYGNGRHTGPNEFASDPEMDRLVELQQQRWLAQRELDD